MAERLGGDATEQADEVGEAAGPAQQIADDEERPAIADLFEGANWADGEEDSTVYEIDVRTEEGAASMRMREWHTVRDGRLVSTVMTFDSSARAALLMHQALMSRQA